MAAVHASDPYSKSQGAVASVLMATAGLALLMACGALFIDSVLDVRAFPDAPIAMSVAEAAQLPEPPRGTWIRLTDARVDCTFAPLGDSSGESFFLLVTDQKDGPRLVVHTSRPPGHCAAWVVSGVLKALDPKQPNHVANLGRNGLDWAHWPTPHIAIIYADSGPANTRIGLWFFPLVGVIGFLLFARGLFNLRAHRRNREPRGPVPKMSRDSLAMPLATGSSVLRGFTFTIGGLQILAFAPLFIAELLPGWVTVPMGILWALWFFAVLAALVEAWGRRASDIILAPEGFLVRAGPLHDTWRAWRDVAPTRTQIVRADASSEDGTLGSLSLDGRLAAVALDPDELRSLAALSETIRSLAAQAAGGLAARTRTGPVGSMHCPSCGAPLPLRDADRVTCASCASVVELPAAARAQLRALDAFEGARAASEHRLRSLLRQRGARATNVLLLLSIPPLLLGWPLTAVVFDELRHTRQLFSVLDGFILFAAAFSFTYGLSWLVRAQVVGREALHIIATRFAALPPEVPGDLPSCRGCFAPLPEGPSTRLVAMCAYCKNENLLGINLVPSALQEITQARSLSQELTARLTRRRRLRLVSLASLVLLLGSLAAFWSRVAGHVGG